MLLYFVLIFDFIVISDSDLWEALRQVHLKDHVAGIPGQLDYVVAESMRSSFVSSFLSFSSSPPLFLCSAE
jgi:ABC-type multidrug transport system fused ATPase/permease subunit